jgi:hypothetical protein
MARDPKVVEYANYLAKCPDDAAVNWLVQNRHVSTQDILEGVFSGYWYAQDKPEWDQLIDGVLYLRRSPAINSALARYGSSAMADFLQKRNLSKSDLVNLAANPAAGGLLWLVYEGQDKDILKAALQNPALSIAEMAILLGAKRAGFGGERKPLDISVDDIVVRLYLISGNERFRQAAKGARQPEDDSPEYIGFPWMDLKDHLGELILSLPVRANTAIAITPACAIRSRSKIQLPLSTVGSLLQPSIRSLWIFCSSFIVTQLVSKWHRKL